MMQAIDPHRLKRTRTSHGLTQDELAKKARLNKQTIYRIESGPVESEKRQRRKGTIERLARALNVDPEVLTGEKPIPTDTIQPAGPTDESAYQLNARVSGAIRNAFSLVALRYKISVSRIVELAPFLFVLAAEGSIRRRRELLDELEGAFDCASRLRPNFPHLPFWIAETYEQSEAVAAEEKSIADRDLFGATIPDHVFALYKSRAEEPQYDEDEDNPFVAYLKELAANHGAAIDVFGPRSTWYRVCQAEANDLAGEDERLANGILNGWVLIHDMPRELLKKDAVSERLEWMRPKIEDAYRAVLGSLGEQEEAK
jgi:transcriptional regulator with XRE-family HTH domain